MARYRSRGAKWEPAEHFLVRGSVDGWFICACGCGYVAVCRHCLPDAPLYVAVAYCDGEQRRLRIGKYAENDREGDAQG